MTAEEAEEEEERRGGALHQVKSGEGTYLSSF